MEVKSLIVTITQSSFYAELKTVHTDHWNWADKWSKHTCKCLVAVAEGGNGKMEIHLKFRTKGFYVENRHQTVR